MTTETIHVNDRQFAVRTFRFLGKCTACVLPIVKEDGEESRDRRSSDRIIAYCPLCGEKVALQRLYALHTDNSCDGACMSATGPHCVCGCGGANHGKRWVAPSVRDIPADYLAEYRAADATRKAAAAKRAEAKERKAKKAMADWRAEHAELLAQMDALTADRYLWVLTDMARQAQTKPLSEKQLKFARVRVDEELNVALSAAYREAEQAAQAETSRWIGEEKATVSVTGTVKTAMKVDGYAVDTYDMMIILVGTGDDEGVIVKWVGSAKAIWDLTAGQEITLTGTVKKHAEYQHVKQTVLTRCKIS